MEENCNINVGAFRIELKNVFDTSFYCRDNLCAKIHHSYEVFFVEFPDENEKKKKKYIAKTCPRDEFESEKYCLSNKCLKSVCVFNDENPIARCDRDLIYIAVKTIKTHAKAMTNAPLNFSMKTALVLIVY
ncbi:hypothetical protein H8356DRAFT_1421318 [Neocallimastix lanati (nom. inval.)]|nr:hypothetical protein H8356DRAFT_1421318 [Neocallimastix sp. JGI-2020a]